MTSPRPLGRPRVHVRQGREALELRVQGTLASAYDPRRGVTGLVWQAMAIPLLALRQCRSVLVLGLGGGSVARVVRTLGPSTHIVGVEHDREVLEAARAHLGLDDLGLEIVVEDALTFLRLEQRRFDAVIEDLFVGSSRRVQKPRWMPSPGLDLAARRLRPGGVLVSNTIHETNAVTRHLAKRRRTLVVLAVAGYWNRIVAWGPRSLVAARLRAAAARHPVLARCLPAVQLRTLKGGASASP